MRIIILASSSSSPPCPAAIPLLISSYLSRGPDFVINIAAVGTIKIKSKIKHEQQMAAGERFISQSKKSQNFSSRLLCLHSHEYVQNRTSECLDCAFLHE